MSTQPVGPWTRYQNAPPAASTEEEGPWTKYQQQNAPTPDAVAAPAPQVSIPKAFQNYVDQAVDAPPTDTGWRGAVERVGQRAMKSFTAPLVHPMDTINGMAQIPTEPWKPIANEVKSVRSDYRQGGIPRVFENAAGDAAGMALQGGVMGAAAEVPGMVRGIHDYARPTPASVPEPELNARAIAKTINPPVSDWNPFIKTLTSHAGDVKDFARRSGIPLKTQLDFRNAAAGAGDEAHSFYRDQVLGPNAERRVMIQAGQPEMTLGEIDKRISEINKELRPSYQQGNMAETESSLAAKRELTAEAGRLQGALIGTLSQRTGIPPEEITALRQRYGGLRDVSRETTEAVNRRASRQEPGRPFTLPSSVADLVKAPFEWALGGKEAIADRGLAKTLKGIPTQATPLPKINAPVEAPPATRSPLWAGIQPEGRGIPRVEPNPANFAAQEATRNTNMESRVTKRAAARIAETQKNAEAARNRAMHGNR